MDSHPDQGPGLISPARSRDSGDRSPRSDLDASAKTQRIAVWIPMPGNENGRNKRLFLEEDHEDDSQEFQNVFNVQVSFLESEADGL